MTTKQRLVKVPVDRFEPLVTTKIEDAVENAKAIAKQTKLAKAERKKKFFEEHKVDAYTPKKMKQRIFSHERIKYKREKRQIAKENIEKEIAPNAFEKLQRIKRAQASHKMQFIDRQNVSLIQDQVRKMKFKRNMTIDEMMKTRQQ